MQQISAHIIAEMQAICRIQLAIKAYSTVPAQLFKRDTTVNIAFRNVLHRPWSLWTPNSTRQSASVAIPRLSISKHGMCHKHVV